jgi:acyl-CoA dehydrogenase
VSASTVIEGRATIAERAEDIGGRVAAAAADDVDRAARFPCEALDALRDAGMMSLLVPVELGGEGASLTEVAGAVEILGRYCASTAMVFAMHQIQVACLVRHGHSEALVDLQRELVASQLLFASATTEIGIGGDVRSSSCYVERDGATFSLEKKAPVISYGAYADAIFATARRTADSPPNDQVLAVCRREDTTLEPMGEWNTLGFRGTCSPGFVLRAKGSTAHILDDAYGDISARTMLPVSHTLWGAVWLGIANAASLKARQYVQAAARSKPGVTPPGAPRLAELVVVHQQFVELVHGAARRFDEAGQDVDVLSSIGFAVAMNTVKLSASALVVDVVQRALLITGISGYREDSEYRMGRLLRDAHGAALMVNNDRIIANNAQLLLVHKE